jgi:Arc/MetJ-type ribon-helix-helix transcriptional regulator
MPSVESKTLTITIPAPIYEALEQEGEALGESASEVVKNGLRLAYKAKEGWTLKLQPRPARDDPNQTELPLPTS